MLPSHTSILIVGAGPTGLAAAVALAHKGCKDILIVDAVDRNDRQHSSRAMVVHAATLEVSGLSCTMYCMTILIPHQALNTIDCAEPLIYVGKKGKGINIYNP